MKIFCLTLCFIILTLPSTYSGTLKDVFGKTVARVETTAQDIGSLFSLKNNSNKQQDDVIVFRDDNEGSSFTTKPEEITMKASVTTTTTQVPTTTVGNVSKDNATEGKDGRENFSGACSTGYMRTPDGRCKPTF